MYIYMKAQFQTFRQKLIKYTDTWGAAFTLGYLIEVDKLSKQFWKAVMGTENYMPRHSLLGTTHLNELFL